MNTAVMHATVDDLCIHVNRELAATFPILVRQFLFDWKQIAIHLSQYAKFVKQPRYRKQTQTPPDTTQGLTTTQQRKTKHLGRLGHAIDFSREIKTTQTFSALW